MECNTEHEYYVSGCNILSIKSVVFYELQYEAQNCKNSIPAFANTKEYEC